MPATLRATRPVDVPYLATARLPASARASHRNLGGFPGAAAPGAHQRTTLRLFAEAQPSQKALEPSSQPQAPLGLQQLNNVTVWLSRVVADAVSLVHKLVQLVQRVRAAAAAIQASAAEQEAAAAATAASTLAAAASSAPAGFQRLSAATVGAVTHLRQTLMDATGTLDVKCRALESTAGDRMSDLFHATRDTAAVLGDTEGQSGRSAAAVAARKYAGQCAESVIQHEEALRAAVFAQVLAELRRTKNSSSGNFGVA